MRPPTRLLLALATALAGCAETPPLRPPAALYPLAPPAPVPAPPPQAVPVVVAPIPRPTPVAVGASPLALDGLAGTCRARVCPRWQGAVERPRVQRRSAGQ